MNCGDQQYVCERFDAYSSTLLYVYVLWYDMM